MIRNQSERTGHLLDRLTAGHGADLAQRLSPGRALLCMSDEAAPVPQAQLCFSFALNLAARLYPVIQELVVLVNRGQHSLVRFPRWHAPTLAEHVSRFLGALSPPLRWSVGEHANAQVDVCMAFGSPEKRWADTTSVIYVGSDGWNASVSPNGPLVFGARINPVGAYAAACMAVGELWKRLLYSHRELLSGVPIMPLEEALTFSTFTYCSASNELNPPLNGILDVRRLTMIGVGAGGGAAAYTLASVGQLRGTLNLIEPDEIESPNLNRYVFADDCDADLHRPKVEVVERIFKDAGLIAVKSLPIPFSQVAGHLSVEDYRYVLAAVHSREARRELQYETPAVLWDGAATEDGEFRVWRMQLGTTECMHCKHPPTASDPEREKAIQVSRLLGLAPETCLQKLRDNAAFTAAEVAAIDLHLAGKMVSFDLPRNGQRFGDWEVSQCGRISLPDQDDEIPIPFAPVMSGVLLAGEIIKEHHFPDQILDSYYWNTLMGQFMRNNRPWRRPPKPGCSFCADPAFRSQFDRRWGQP